MLLENEHSAPVLSKHDMLRHRQPNYILNEEFSGFHFSITIVKDR